MRSGNEKERKRERNCGKVSRERRVEKRNAHVKVQLFANNFLPIWNKAILSLVFLINNLLDRYSYYYCVIATPLILLCFNEKQRNVESEKSFQLPGKKNF